jgi:predicted aspartyl protease
VTVFPGARSVFAGIVLLSKIGLCHGGVTLDALGAYLSKNGYGGAQLAHPGNFYYLPIESNGKPGNLLIDTGAPTTLIFRWSLKGLNLIESKTKSPVSGAFGQSREFYGLTTIRALGAGNCMLVNVPVAVAPGSTRSTFSRANSNGLLGLREMIKFGAVLDLRNRLIYLRPSRPSGEMGHEINSILLRQGYTPVPLSISDFHIRIPGAVNETPCYFLVDTGAYLTGLDLDFVRRAKIQVEPTPFVAEGLGGSSLIGMGIIASLRIGNYEIRRASTSIVHFASKAVSRGTRSEVAGLIGVEYLGLSSAIFDFTTGTMYLRPGSR